MNLKQAFPIPSAPMVDGSGRPTRVWLDFFALQFARTGSGPGPASPAPVVADDAMLAALDGDAGDGVAARQALDASMLAALADVPDGAPNLVPLTAGQADLQIMQAMADAPDAPPAPDGFALFDELPDVPNLDQPALLALALSD